eukprot:CAMPEP_0172672476 /NCGR_PEP_ID=MMETSP1074-20121228/11572_1 /TAXON_ID=2916 /ORGANISM="Ceratium fusus, Strain PA161109" /LENGTH=144 /DNA_ID=CAMNT_0013489673 /DNA_START=126 /DNA_END=560 /DNA_ORIENTATION=+
MSFPGLPIAKVALAIDPMENPKTMFLVVLILTLVEPTIRPYALAPTVHHGGSPLPFEMSIVVAQVVALALNLVTKPCAAVDRAILPSVLAKPVLFAFLELALEMRLLGPSLNTMAILQVIFELTTVDCLSTPMSKHANAMSNVI